jgi:DNA primase
MNDVEEVKARTDIGELVGRYVQLKQAGRNLKGLCPFHSEKTPSFMVSPEKGIWHCFGCHLGGDAIAFYQKIENVDFPEALEELARRAGVTLERRASTKNTQEGERLVEMHREAARFFVAQLKSPKGAAARAYLTDRGITEASLARFGVGFAPDEWEALAKHLKTKGFKEEELLQSGLGIRGKRGIYDRFRARIIFPIWDHRDRVVGFAGRILPGESETAKYLNSPDSPIYHKGDVLYGLKQAREAIRSSEEAVLVEGNLDVILSSQAGLPQVVAASGTALTELQLSRLARLTKRVVLAFDPDSAGLAALERVAALKRSADLNLYVAPLPQGQDPADLALRDPEAWKRLVADATYLYDYLLEQVLARHKIATAPGKREASRELLTYFRAIPDEVERSHYLRLLAERLGVAEEDVRRAAGPTSRPEVEATGEAEAAETSEERLESYLLGLILSDGSKLAGVARELPADAFRNRDYRLLYTELLERYNTGALPVGPISTGELPSELRKVADLLSLSAEYRELPDESVPQEADQLADRLKRRYFHLLQTRLGEAIRAAEAAGDRSRVAELTAKFQRVTEAAQK